MIVNRGKLLDKFVSYSALLKMRELPEFLNDPSLFNQEQSKALNSRKITKDTKIYEDENWMVANYECLGPRRSPVCLFDFTIKQLYNE